MKKKNIYILLFIVIILIIIFITQTYSKILGINTIKGGDFLIKTNTSFAELSKNLTPFVKDISAFQWTAELKKFSKPKAGRYILKENMSNNELVNLLRSGNQTPIKLSFNNQNTLSDFSSRIANQLEIDSLTIREVFTDKIFLEKNNFTEKTILQICLPNTYEFYWNISAKEFRNRMLKEYKKFWNENRLSKAKKLNLTKNEVIVLASIVQKETTKNIERPIVAGLYLNRLRKGWPLQADPTIIYCIKSIKGENYVVKRVLRKDLEINSPYNTYKYRGLPPSQISMPDISSIDAVLNSKKHNYFYMCADISKIGYHKFAKTLAQHNRNAAEYQNWLNRKGINR